MKRVERAFVVRGRVQGVGFRWWTRQTADTLGVVGTVENLPDGTVRIVAGADAETMTRFADKLRHGPGMARVDAVDETDAELPEDLDSFSIRHR